MVQAYRIRPEVRDLIPAVVHEDGTGRLQTVEETVNPRYWKLLKQFENANRHSGSDQHIVQ